MYIGASSVTSTSRGEFPNPRLVLCSSLHVSVTICIGDDLGNLPARCCAHSSQCISEIFGVSEERLPSGEVGVSRRHRRAGAFRARPVAGRGAARHAAFAGVGRIGCRGRGGAVRRFAPGRAAHKSRRGALLALARAMRCIPRAPIRPSSCWSPADDVIPHRASRCFCCSSGKLSAIEISSTAEIPGCRRFGER
jgi:hypothetical protein